MTSTDPQIRRHQLFATARAYVVDGLGKGDFDAIPYDAGVELRAPLCPGGASVPLRGVDALRTIWWPPLPDLVSSVELIQVYASEDLSGAAAEFLCHIREPRCTLRIIDRFSVDANGRITAQENFFDPRDLTHPGWRDGG